MKKLLICKSKTTYQVLNGIRNASVVIEAGEQVYLGDTVCIREQRSDDINENINALLNPNDTEKSNTFDFIADCMKECSFAEMITNIVIEENRIYKQHDTGRIEQELYYTIVYNVMTTAGQSIANEFLVLDLLDEQARETVIRKIMEEIEWNNKKRIACEELDEQWIFSAQAAGFFFHECIGHFLEEEQFVLSEYKKGDALFTAPINIFENYGLYNSLDDYDTKIVPDIKLLEKGRILNILTAQENPKSGNAYTQEPFVEPLARMNVMYVDTEQPVENLFAGVERGIYIREITAGEYNPLNGEIGLVVAKASRIENGVETVAYRQKNLLFHIKDLLFADIALSDHRQRIHSLCGKKGAVKKITYMVPEMKIDWRKNGKLITDRYFRSENSQ